MSGKIRREQINQNDWQCESLSALEKDNPIWISNYEMLDYIETSEKVLMPLVETGKFDLTISDKPQSSKQ